MSRRSRTSAPSAAAAGSATSTPARNSKPSDNKRDPRPKAVDSLAEILSSGVVRQVVPAAGEEKEKIMLEPKPKEPGEGDGTEPPAVGTEAAKKDEAAKTEEKKVEE